MDILHIYIMDILICVCIIFILLITHALWPKYVYNARYDSLKVADNDLNTGDIILIRNCTKCKYNNDHMNNGFQWVYRNLFNSLRWYIIDQASYTHTAIIIRLNIDGQEKPYMCHMDGGMPMYDEYRKKYIAGTGFVVSDLKYVNECGGVINVYKYKGPQIKKDMRYWINSNNDINYPNIYKLIMTNGLKYDTHKKNVMACTDLIENALRYMEITDKKPTGQSTINDILTFIRDSAHYDKIPMVVNNKCYESKHFK